MACAQVAASLSPFPYQEAVTHLLANWGPLDARVGVGPASAAPRLGHGRSGTESRSPWSTRRGQPSCRDAAGETLQEGHSFRA